MDSSLLSFAVKYHGADLVPYFEKEQQDAIPQRVMEHLAKLPRTEKEIGDEEFQKKLQSFIARKADILFKPVDDHSDVTHQDISSEDKYAIMPPLESFMGIPQPSMKEHFFKCLEKKDILIGLVSSVLDNGLVLTLLCEDCGKSRDIDSLKITAFCPVKELPKIYSDKSTTDVFQVKDIVRGVVLSVNRETEKIFVSLLNRSLPPDREYPKLGLITEDDFPVYYRRKLHIRGLTFDELLSSILGFNNSGNVNCLLNQLNQKDFNSLTRSLHNLNVPEKDFADKLRKAQSQRWARNSVAQGISYFKAGKQTEAIQHLNKALQIDKDNVDALVARGALYANNESYSRAIEDFEKALEVNPTHQNALTYIHETLLAKGRQFEDQGSFEEASELYQKALSLKPGSQEVKECMRRLDLKKHRLKPSYSERRATPPYSPDENTLRRSGRIRERSVSPISKTRETLKKLIDDDNKKDKSHSSKRRKSSESSPPHREHQSRKDLYYRERDVKQWRESRHGSEERKHFGRCDNSLHGMKDKISREPYEEADRRKSYRSRSPLDSEHGRSRSHKSHDQMYDKDKSPSHQYRQEYRNQMRQVDCRQISPEKQRKIEERSNVSRRSPSANAKDEHFKIAPLITDRSKNIAGYEDFENQSYDFAPSQSESKHFQTDVSVDEREPVSLNKHSTNFITDGQRRKKSVEYSERYEEYTVPNRHEDDRSVFSSSSKRNDSYHILHDKSDGRDKYTSHEKLVRRRESQKGSDFSLSPDRKNWGGSYSSECERSNKIERRPLHLISPQKREKESAYRRSPYDDQHENRYISREYSPRNDTRHLGNRRSEKYTSTNISPQRGERQYEEFQHSRREQYADDCSSSHPNRSLYTYGQYSGGLTEQDEDYYTKCNPPDDRDTISRPYNLRIDMSPHGQRRHYSPCHDRKYFSPHRGQYSKPFSPDEERQNIYSPRRERWHGKIDDYKHDKWQERERRTSKLYIPDIIPYERSHELSPISSTNKYPHGSPSDNRTHRRSVSPSRKNENERYDRRDANERQQRASNRESCDEQESNRMISHSSRHSLEWQDRQVTLASRHLSKSPEQQYHRESFPPDMKNNRFSHYENRQPLRSPLNDTADHHVRRKQDIQDTVNRQDKDRYHGDERQVYISRSDKDHSPDMFSRKVEVYSKTDNANNSRGNSPWERDKDYLRTKVSHQRRRSHRSVTPDALSLKSRDYMQERHGKDKDIDQTKRDRRGSSEDRYLYGEKIIDKGLQQQHDSNKMSTRKDSRKDNDRKSSPRTKQKDKDEKVSKSNKNKLDKKREKDDSIHRKEESPVSQTSSKKKHESPISGTSSKKKRKRSKSIKKKQKKKTNYNLESKQKQVITQDTARALVFPEMKSKWDSISPNVVGTPSKEDIRDVRINKFPLDYENVSIFQQSEDKPSEASAPDKMTKLLQYISETRPKRAKSADRRSGSSSDSSSGYSGTSDSDSTSSDSDSSGGSRRSESFEHTFRGRNILRHVDSYSESYGRRVIGLHDKLSDDEKGNRLHSQSKSKTSVSPERMKNKPRSRERNKKSYSPDKHKSHSRQKRSRSKHRSRSHERGRVKGEKRYEESQSSDYRNSRKRSRSRSHSMGRKDRKKGGSSHLPDLISDSFYSKKKTSCRERNERRSSPIHASDERDRGRSKNSSRIEAKISSKKVDSCRSDSDKRHSASMEKGDKEKKRRRSSTDAHDKREGKRRKISQEDRRDLDKSSNIETRIPSPDKNTLIDLEVFLNTLKDKQKEQWKSEGKLKHGLNM